MVSSISLIKGAYCIPIYTTGYLANETPLGPFGGSGGGIPIYDVIGFNTVKIIPDDVELINSLYLKFSLLSSEQQKRINLSISRLSQAKRAMQIEDKILDLCISIEMLLLEDNKNNDQLRQSFRLRGSWLMGKDFKEREQIDLVLREIYDLRCQVAHSGILHNNDFEKKQKVINLFPSYVNLAERIIQKLILFPKPDWKNLILGKDV